MLLDERILDPCSLTWNSDSKAVADIIIASLQIRTLQLSILRLWGLIYELIKIITLNFSFYFLVFDLHTKQITFLNLGNLFLQDSHPAELM